jgi:NADH dehydrogenase
LSDGVLQYDQLIFAAGTKTNFFGNEGIRQKAISLKGIDDALYMRNQLMKVMEKAVVEKDPACRNKLLTMVIAGGGPTGVEVAGMLAEMKKHIQEKDYPELIGAEGDIHIVDGMPVLLAPMSEKSQREAFGILAKLGVKIKLNARVISFDNDEVTFSDNTVIAAGTLIWAAGVTAITFEGIPTTCLSAGNRMLTDVYNQVIGLKNIWAIGDISIQETDPVYPKGHPSWHNLLYSRGIPSLKTSLRLQMEKVCVLSNISTGGYGHNRP